LTDRPVIHQVDDLDGGPSYPVLMLDDERGSGRWESVPIEAGRPLAPGRLATTATGKASA
jgi:methionyl-tRNA synthetase